MNRLFTITLPALLCASLTLTSTVSAQEKFAAPSEAQVQLYVKAIEAIKADNFEDAIDLLKSSLALGELNIIYLNLGRAYFRNGECDKAMDAYDKVLTAPKVTDPSPDTIAATLEEFRGELSACPGKVEVACIPASLTVSIDGKVPVPCSESPFLLPPGEHVLTGASGDKRAEARVTVESRKNHSVTLNAEPEVAPPPPPSEGVSGMTVAALVTAGVGLAAVTTGIIIDQTSLSNSIDEYAEAVEEGAENEETLRDDTEALQGRVLLLYVGGGVALATAATLMAIELGAEDEEAAATGLTPWVTPEGGGGVGWSTSW